MDSNTGSSGSGVRVPTLPWDDEIPVKDGGSEDPRVKVKERKVGVPGPRWTEKGLEDRDWCRPCRGPEERGRRHVPK